jgi:type II secretory pathway pseudopilin PulG
VDRSSFPERLRSARGFTLIELLVCTLVLTTGLIAIAGLLLVTTDMQVGAREVTRSTRLAQGKIDELMKLNFATAPAIQAPGGSLTSDVANYFDTPAPNITRRWTVQAGPAANTRILTVRVVNLGARQYGREVNMTTVMRQW